MFGGSTGPDDLLLVGGAECPGYCWRLVSLGSRPTSLVGLSLPQTCADFLVVRR